MRHKNSSQWPVAGFQVPTPTAVFAPMLVREILRSG